MTRKYHHYTPEQKQWIMDNCHRKQYADFTAAFNSHFDLDLTELQIKGFLWNNKIKTGSYRRRPLPEGSLNAEGKKIKVKSEHGNQKWQGLHSFLRINELKRAAKEKLKNTDNELYKKNKGGHKNYWIDNKALVAELLKT